MDNCVTVKSCPRKSVQCLEGVTGRRAQIAIVSWPFSYSPNSAVDTSLPSHPSHRSHITAAQPNLPLDSFRARDGLSPCYRNSSKMSAFPESGRSDRLNTAIFRGRFRPEADVAGLIQSSTTPIQDEGVIFHSKSSGLTISTCARLRVRQVERNE